MLSKFVIGLEVSSFMLSNESIDFSVNGNIEFHQGGSEIVDVNGTLCIVLNGFGHSLLESVA